MARRRREQRAPVDIWPGFVDALSTLLLAVIFMLVVFVLGQFFLGQLLQRRDETAVVQDRAIAALRTDLEQERAAAADLRRTLGQLSADLQLALGDRDAAVARIGQSEAARATLEATLARAQAERLVLERAAQDERRARGDADAAAQALRRELDAARETVRADRATIEAQLADLVRLRRDIDALAEVKATLERDVGELASRARASAAERDRLVAELGQVRDRSAALEAELGRTVERTLLQERAIAERASAVEALQRELDAEVAAKLDTTTQMQRLQRQVEALSGQLRALDAALQLRQTEIDRQSTTIADLGRRLNLALASKVEELTRYRSDFFGKVSAVLGEREDVRVVGDRFVFQSEVLFRPGEAEIGTEGRARLAQLARALREIIGDIPDDLPWVLQVDGHTDRRPIATARFPSNWELSTARAISVARVLIDQGIPPDRVAARGFAEFAPLDPADTDDAYRRNRRIELKLTTR
jgi:chemotaxis protein MotB